MLINQKQHIEFNVNQPRKINVNQPNRYTLQKALTESFKMRKREAARTRRSGDGNVDYVHGE